MIDEKPYYFTQLNGIRFVAVFLVLLDHWLVPINPLDFILGHIGVVIFFVLSGFLISRILFQQVDSLKTNQGLTIGGIIKRFIFRRSLRIFPIYILLLCIGFLFNISSFSDYWPWLVSYTSNIYIITYSKWLGNWDHLWTLAVEEQYYLIFPYFIVFAPIRKYIFIFSFMFIIGLASRLCYFMIYDFDIIEKNWMIWYVNPISSLDCFGLGGLLAYLYHYKQHVFQRLLQFNYTILFSGLCILFVFIMGKYSQYPHANIWSIIFERLSIAIFSFYLIAHSLGSTKWLLSGFFENKIISYLGKISYGIYLYHNFVYNFYHEKGNTLLGLISPILNRFQLDLISFTFLKFFISLFLVIVLASLSWFFIEKPINSFKNQI